MSHKYIYESCYAHKHIYIYQKSLTWSCAVIPSPVVSYKFISHVTHIYTYQLCHTLICMNYVTHIYIYDSCPTCMYIRFVTHIYIYISEEPHTKSRSGPFTCHMSHVTRIYLWVMSHICVYISDLKWSCAVNPLLLMSHKYICHITHIYTHQFCHTLVYMSYVTRIYIWVMSHDVYMIHVTHTYIYQKSLKRSRARNGLFTCHGEDTKNALSCRSFFAEEPPITGLFCGKWPAEIRHPVSLRHSVPVMSHKCTSHVTHIYIYMSYVTHIYIWVMSHVYTCESCHTYLYIRFMSLTRIYIYIYIRRGSHEVARGHLTCHVTQKYIWVPLICHVTYKDLWFMPLMYTYELWHTHKYEACHTHICVVSHTYMYISHATHICMHGTSRTYP